MTGTDVLIYGKRGKEGVGSPHCCLVKKEKPGGKKSPETSPVKNAGRDTLLIGEKGGEAICEGEKNETWVCCSNPLVGTKKGTGSGSS